MSHAVMRVLRFPLLLCKVTATRLRSPPQSGRHTINPGSIKPAAPGGGTCKKVVHTALTEEDARLYVRHSGVPRVRVFPLGCARATQTSRFWIHLRVVYNIINKIGPQSQATGRAVAVRNPHMPRPPHKRTSRTPR